MEIRSQRATSIIETTVAIGIVAAVAGATLGATSMAARNAGNDTIRSVLQDAAEREMAIAVDVLKYRGSAISPASVATALPMPAGSPLPAVLSIGTATAPSGAISISIVASASSPAFSATVDAVVTQQAPLPGAQMREPVLAPAPTGAP